MGSKLREDVLKQKEWERDCESSEGKGLFDMRGDVCRLPV